MKKLVRMGLCLAALSLTTLGSGPLAPRAAHAQPMEYCPDLGVLVSHGDGGLVVQGMRRVAIARQLGLRPGDVIFAINGQHPDTLSQLHSMVFSGADNEDHDLDVLRGGRHLHTAIFHVNGQVLTHTSLH